MELSQTLPSDGHEARGRSRARARTGLPLSAHLGDTAASADARPVSATAVRYGVGVRVFGDPGLLRQIRAEVARNRMRPEDIAVLENVTPQTLIDVLQHGAGAERDPVAPLRAFVDARQGFQLLAWRTSREHASKLHIITAAGLALCGTPCGAQPAPVHSGPCRTCAAHLGLKLSAAGA